LDIDPKSINPDRLFPELPLFSLTAADLFVAPLPFKANERPPHSKSTRDALIRHSFKATEKAARKDDLAILAWMRVTFIRIGRPKNCFQ
jgi:hypothetical protein